MFKLHGLADEAVCVVLEDIKVTCVFLELRWLGPRVEEKGRIAGGRSLPK